MLQPERFDKIIQIVNEKRVVTVNDLCEMLGASKATIRRDISELDKRRSLNKTHGGATKIIKEVTEDLPMDIRRSMNREEKKRIAHVAVEFIQEGDSIFLDSGTTTFEIAVKLRNFKHLTVLTNDLSIAVEVSQNTDNGLIMVGGKLKKSTTACTGFFAEQMAGAVHVDKAFFAADAVNVENGYMSYNVDEISIKNIMLKNSRSRFMVCDHTKFESAAFVSICPVNAIEVIITGIEIDKTSLNKFTDFGVKICTV